MIVRKSTKIHSGSSSRVRQFAPVKTFAGLPEDQRKLFCDAAKQIRQIYPRAVCYAFGSRTHGTCTEQSDIDIMVGGISRDQYDILLSALKPCGKLRIDAQLGKPTRMAEVWQISDRMSK